MDVLIIGGTRFIGAHVARQLVERGARVTVFHRGVTEAALPEEVRHVRSPLAAMPVTDFPTELRKRSWDAIIHMIAMGEADAEAAVRSFSGKAGRLVVPSSGDVYRAYGRLIGLEPGPIEPVPLSEDSPIRTILHPYRASARAPDELGYYYEKILVERALLGQAGLPATVLRLPKVYGPGGNADFATVHAYAHQPDWRWTHGYVENVAAAIVLAALHSAAAGNIYNVGEEPTPSVGERLRMIPPSPIEPDRSSSFDFAQDLIYDTSRIRRDLGYEEIVSWEEGLARTLSAPG